MNYAWVLCSLVLAAVVMATPGDPAEPSTSQGDPPRLPAKSESPAIKPIRADVRVQIGRSRLAHASHPRWSDEPSWPKQFRITEVVFSVAAKPDDVDVFAVHGLNPDVSAFLPVNRERMVPELDDKSTEAEQWRQLLVMDTWGRAVVNFDLGHLTRLSTEQPDDMGARTTIEREDVTIVRRTWQRTEGGWTYKIELLRPVEDPARYGFPKWNPLQYYAGDELVDSEHQGAIAYCTVSREIQVWRDGEPLWDTLKRYVDPELILDCEMRRGDPKATTPE